MQKKYKYIIVIGLLFVNILLFVSVDKESNYSNIILSNTSVSQNKEDSIKFAIATNTGIFATKGYSIGFQYKLINKFTKQYNYSKKVIPPYSEYDFWEMLINSEIDILILDTSQDTIPSKYIPYILESYPIYDNVWIIKKGDIKLWERANFWLASFSKTKEFSSLGLQYYRSYKIEKHLKKMSKTDMISPYDKIIKDNSKLLGWDWRLLSALIYQESRFTMGAFSHKGAVGLMQIKPSTAKRYKIEDIFNPTSNIKAGALHLRYLQSLYNKKGIDSLNSIKFTLAAYNAGEGRINSCIRFATALDKNYQIWDTVTTVIPLMRQIDAPTSDSLNVKRFNGKETINYVNNILKRYEEYKEVVKP